MSKKTPKKIIQITLIFALIISFGFLGYRIFIQNNADELPPALEYDTHFGQGIAIIDDEKSFRFDENDVDEFNRLSSELQVYSREAGVNYMYTESNLTVQAVINSIKPDPDNSFIIATYNRPEDRFYTYPKGPFEGTYKLGQHSYIDRYSGIIVIAEKDFETTKDLRDPKYDINYDIYSSSPWMFGNGWNLLYIKNDASLANILGLYADSIKSFYVQSQQSSFEEGDFGNPKLKNDYHFVWFKLEDHYVDSEQPSEVSSITVENSDDGVLVRWSEATDDVGIKGYSLRYGKGSVSEVSKEYERYLLVGNGLEYTMPFESFEDNEEYFFSMIARDTYGKQSNSWSEDVSIIVDYSDEVKVELQAYIDATVEAICFLYESDPLDPTLESKSMEIFKEYGFDIDDENAMDKIASKYSDNKEYLDQVKEKSKACTNIMFNSAIESLARDTGRIADLQKLQRILVNYELENGSGYPTVSGPISTNLSTGWTESGKPTTWLGIYSLLSSESFNLDPLIEYKYISGSNLDGYIFALYAKIQNFKNSNANCTDLYNASSVNKLSEIKTPDETDSSTWCYAILTM
jgi:hypothetical protein